MLPSLLISMLLLILPDTKYYTHTQQPQVHSQVHTLKRDMLKTEHVMYCQLLWLRGVSSKNKTTSMQAHFCMTA